MPDISHLEKFQWRTIVARAISRCQPNRSKRWIHGGEPHRSGSEHDPEPGPHVELGQLLEDDEHSELPRIADCVRRERTSDTPLAEDVASQKFLAAVSKGGASERQRELACTSRREKRIKG